MTLVDSPLVATLDRLIGGEWHPWHGAEGRTREDFAALLPSHDVTFDPLGLVEGPGGFTARLRQVG